MTDLARLLTPKSVAIAGLSADASKHGQRVLTNMRRLGFAGEISGINPRLPNIDGIEVVASIAELTNVPDVVISAVPAPAVPALASEAATAGVGALIIFAGGFAESGAAGLAMQAQLAEISRGSDLRILGPNSGGVIAPSHGLAMSFLTCLDRPSHEIREGRVGLVTQSGGMGSYVHNLAAACGDGLAASISTGNEVDIDVGDGISALTALDEVQSIAVILESVRDGAGFVRSVEAAHKAGKPVIALRIGRSTTGMRLMSTHTGSLAGPERVLRGVLDALAVPVAETPAEMFEIASILGRSKKATGRRVGIATHSGGLAILLSDLAEGTAIELPTFGSALRSDLAPLLQQGALDNPLDMGGIIGGAHRFGEVVQILAASGDVDAVLAVSSAHPPVHSQGRVESLISISNDIPIVHLWMAGDVGAAALQTLRNAGAAVSEEPRAAIAAVSAIVDVRDHSQPSLQRPTPAPGTALTEFEAKQVIAAWDVPVVEGYAALSSAEAVEAAERLGYPVVIKLSSPDIVHKSETGAVILNVTDRDAVRVAFDAVHSRAPHGTRIAGALIERQVSGPEVIIGAVRDDVFGPMVLVGLGGVAAEALNDVHIAPAPISTAAARRLIDKLGGLTLLTEPRSGPPADLDTLAQHVSTVSEHVAINSWVASLDLNPVAWSGTGWVVLDAAVEVSA